MGLYRFPNTKNCTLFLNKLKIALDKTSETLLQKSNSSWDIKIVRTKTSLQRLKTY